MDVHIQKQKKELQHSSSHHIQNLLKKDHRPKCKKENFKTSGRKHRREILLLLVTLDFYKSINHKSEKIISWTLKIKEFAKCMQQNRNRLTEKTNQCLPVGEIRGEGQETGVGLRDAKYQVTNQ